MTWEEEMKERARELAEELKEEAVAEVAAEAFEEGSAQRAVETARKLLGMALALEQIAEATGLPLAQVERLRQEAVAVKV